MTNSNRGRPKQETSSVNQLPKRRTSCQLESPSTHMKKRRLFFPKSEPATRNPRHNWSLHTSNKFEAFHPSSRVRRNKLARKSSDNVSSRRWVFPSKDHFNKDKIVVVSYNILGVENALKHPDLYSNIPRRCLEWERRKLLIHEEVNNYNGSILCFQEVDRFNNLDGLLQNDGFKGSHRGSI